MCLFLVSGIMTQLEALNTEYNQFSMVVKELEEQRKVLEEEKYDADKELEKLRSDLKEKELQLEVRMKDFENVKEREVHLLGDR